MVTDSMADIQVEVVFARPDQSWCIPVTLPVGSTIADAINQSGLLARCPEIDLRHNQVGVFSQLRDLADRLEDGDRIEIYRPLQVDPKEARRRRAQKRAGH